MTDDILAILKEWQGVSKQRLEIELEWDEFSRKRDEIVSDLNREEEEIRLVRCSVGEKEAQLFTRLRKAVAEAPDA